MTASRTTPSPKTAKTLLHWPQVPENTQNGNGLLLQKVGMDLAPAPRRLGAGVGASGVRAPLAKDMTRPDPSRAYLTGQGLAPQISVAYSWIVRSLENLPEAAMLWITLRAQSSGLPWSAQTAASARR